MNGCGEDSHIGRVLTYLWGDRVVLPSEGLTALLKPSISRSSCLIYSSIIRMELLSLTYSSILSGKSMILFLSSPVMYPINPPSFLYLYGYIIPFLWIYIKLNVILFTQSDVPLSYLIPVLFLF